MSHRLGPRVVQGAVKQALSIEMFNAVTNAASLNSETARAAGRLIVNGVTMPTTTPGFVVDPANTLLFPLGNRAEGAPDAGGVNPLAAQLGCFALSDKNTVTYTFTYIAVGNYGPLHAYFSLQEFYPGVIRNVQRGQVSFTGTTFVNSVVFGTPIPMARLGMTLLGTDDNSGAGEFDSQFILRMVPTLDTAKQAATGLTITSGASSSTIRNINFNYQAWEWCPLR